MRRALLTPRWIVFTLLALLVVLVCARLGLWQLDRLHGRRYFNERFRTGMAMAPRPVEDLLASGERPLAYRQAVAAGRYDVGREVLLYGRALDGRPGDHVLTPLILDDGGAVLIDRGWVPVDTDPASSDGIAPPEGRVRVTGFLSPDEPGGADDAGSGEGSSGASIFTKVDLEAIGGQLPYELLPWYLALQEQAPPQPDDLPAVVPAPTLDDGPHLSYAFQWFAFAAIAAIGYAILFRRQLSEARVGTGIDRPARP